MKISTLILPLASLVALSAAGAEDGGRPLSTMLTGAAEVPGPGDTDGTGTADIKVNPGQTEICYSLTVSGIDPATAAHIHRGAATVAGPVVVPLAAPASGASKGCATVTRELATEIIKDPEAFYVNVHNRAFPQGAVRGQLSKK
jgi:CHRD domain